MISCPDLRRVCSPLGPLINSLLTNILTCSRIWPSGVQRRSQTLGCCCANNARSSSTGLARKAIWLLPPLIALNVDGRRKVTAALSSSLIVVPPDNFFVVAIAYRSFFVHSIMVGPLEISEYATTDFPESIKATSDVCKSLKHTALALAAPGCEHTPGGDEIWLLQFSKHLLVDGVILFRHTHPPA